MESSDWVQYCYRCFLWISNVDTWTRHCEEHLARLSFRCEVKTSRYTLITPGLCPFCVGNCQLPANESFCQWKSPKALWDHVQAHIDNVAEGPLPCPHPMCNTVLQNTQSFDYHMVDMHGKSHIHLGSNPTSTTSKTAGKSEKSMISKARPDKSALRSKSLSLPGQSVFKMRSVNTIFNSE